MDGARILGGCDDGRGGRGLDGQRISDEDLARQIRDGNEPAFEALVHRYHRPLLGYLYRMCHDYHLAEEAAQECFTRFYVARARYKYPNPLRPYLYAIASNCLRDYLKSAYARHVIAHSPASGAFSDRASRRRTNAADASCGAGAVCVVSASAISDVEGLCDHLLVLDGGRLVFAGTPDRLLRAAEGRAFAAEVPFGPNGAGKTTLMRILATLVDPT